VGNPTCLVPASMLWQSKQNTKIQYANIALFCFLLRWVFHNDRKGASLLSFRELDSKGKR
jgi:hypothetical protein